MGELRMCDNMYSVDVICVCETHLNKEIDDFEVNISCFTSYRVDRKFKIPKENGGLPGKDGGGALILQEEEGLLFILERISMQNVLIVSMLQTLLRYLFRLM